MLKLSGDSKRPLDEFAVRLMAQTKFEEQIAEAIERGRRKFYKAHEAKLAEAAQLNS